MTSSIVTQVRVIARRSVIRTFRQPASVFPLIMFPLILFAINSNGLASATNLPGFPASRYINFAIAATFMQSALFASTTAGQGLAEDIERGFLNRLALTPMRGAALVLGQLAGGISIAFIASITYIIVGFATGVEIASGFPGVLLLIVLSCLTALAFASVGAWMALQTGSSEAVQGLFPLLFVAFFLSSVNLPRELMTVDWFHAVASANPLSYMVEGLRSLIITGWDSSALLADIGVLALVTVISLTACSRALRTRLVRT